MKRQKQQKATEALKVRTRIRAGAITIRKPPPCPIDEDGFIEDPAR